MCTCEGQDGWMTYCRVVSRAELQQLNGIQAYETVRKQSIGAQNARHSIIFSSNSAGQRHRSVFHV